MDGASLAPLQVDAASSCYRRGPGSSERMAVLPPGHGLQEIDCIEINRFVVRDGVTYYVLDVFTHQQKAKAARFVPSRVVGMPVDESADNEVLIDVDLNATPAFQLERRFREFEALRNKLSVCFENLHPGSCRYCDKFITFLSCSSIQPGIFTKLTKAAPQRKPILANFINQTIRLALATTSSDDDEGGPVHCDGWAIIPQVVESFLREPRSVFRQGS